MTSSSPASPYRATFDCLWCGTAGPHAARTTSRAGRSCARPASGRRARTRSSGPAAIRDRARASAGPSGAGDGPIAHARRPPPVRRPLRRRRRPVHPPAPAPPRGATPRRASSLPAPAPTTFPDDWFIRRGDFARGRAPRHGLGGRARRRHPLARRPAAGGAGRGAGRGHRVLLAADRRQGRAPRDGPRRRRARSRARPARSPIACARTSTSRTRGSCRPDRASPGRTRVLATFLLGRVRGAGLDTATASLLARLRPGGRLASIELLPDPAGGPPDSIPWTWHAPRRHGGVAPPGGVPRARAHDDRALLRAHRGRGGLSAASRNRAVAPVGAAGTRCYPPARCPPSRTARSRRSAPASWPRR